MTTTWTLGFETSKDHPQPYVEQSGSADFLLGFAASVIAGGWTLTSVKLETRYHCHRGLCDGAMVLVGDRESHNEYHDAHGG